MTDVIVTTAPPTVLIVTQNVAPSVIVDHEGPPGADGAPGVGVPTGGTTGQALIKTSGADYDTEWATAGGSSAGEVRHDWAAPHSYMASAPAGTAESATGWRITRITVADAGTATVAVCLDGAWTTREGAIYG